MSRRGFLALLAFPTLALTAVLDRIASVPYRETSDRLTPLYETLRAAWEANWAAKVALRPIDDKLWEIAPRDISPEDRAEYEMRRNAVRTSWTAMRAAYFTLLRAVLETPGFERPTEESWNRYGNPIAKVRAGNLLFVVTPDDDSDFDEFVDGEVGFCSITIIDLGSIGGGS